MNNDRGRTPRVGVDVSQVASGQKLIDTSDVENVGNFVQHIFKVNMREQLKIGHWLHKNSTSSRTLSPTSQNNSPCNGKD